MSSAARFSRFLRSLSRRPAALVADEGGTVAVAFALTALVALALMGAAVDYSRDVGAEQKLQTAVDGAMLAAVKAPTASRASVADAALQANLANSGIAATWSQTPTLNADGSVTGAVRGTVGTTVMKMAGMGSMNLSASATAQYAPASTASDVVFTLTGAYGWYWKQVDLYVHQKGAAADTLLASYRYQPVDLSYQSGRGSGDVTASFLTGGVMVANAIDTPVSMGTTYDNAYLKMTVYTDGCGPGMAPTTSQSGSTTNYNCVASGTRVQTGWSWWGGATYTTYTKSATPVVYSTNDASTAHNLFVNGAMLPNSQTPSIFTLLPCGQTSTQAWEDTPWANPLPGSWSTQDIFFNVQTTCSANANYQSNVPRLKS